MVIRGRRSKRARGRGRSDPPQPSTSLGVKNDKNRIQKKGPVKGFDALNNKQKSAPFNSEQNDENNNYNDGEDEEMQFVKIDQRQLLKQQAADANNSQKCIEASFGVSNNVRPSSGGSHVETDRQKVISLEGVSNPGRRITRGQGRGRSDLQGPSQLCNDPPPQPVYTSVFPGVQNDKNRIQKKGQGKGVDTLNNKQKSTALNSQQNERCGNNGEDEELQLIIDRICQSQLHKQATDANNVQNFIGSNHGLSNKARSSSIGYHVEADIGKVISVEGISNPGIGIRRGRGRGRSDPPGPSQSCINPPPQPAHTSVTPGVKNDKNRIQKKGRGKGVDEELELITEKTIQPQLHKQQATNANNVEKYIGSNFGLSHNLRSSSVGNHVETDTRKVISVEGISNPGRGIKRGRGRGRSDLPGPSQSCIDPSPPPAHTLVSPGVQRKGLVDAINNKQKATAFTSEDNDEYYGYSDGEDEEMQLIMEKIYQRQLLKQQAAIANNVTKCIGDRFGLSNKVRPSSGGSHIEADRRKVVSVESIPNPGKGIKRGRGRGRSDPSGPSQSCIDPPPPAAQTLVSPGAAADYGSWQNAHATVFHRGDTSATMGMKNDKNKMQKEGLVKGFTALTNKQKFTAVSSGESDEYSDYDDGEDEDPDYGDGEDEEMEPIGEKNIEQQSLKQQVADTNNVKQCNRGNSGLSNHGSMDSASSDSDPHSTHPPANDATSLLLSGRSGVGIDKRKVISIEDNSNPRRFVPQSVTREITSTVIARMPTPAAKWKDYPIGMKDELFKEFMGKYTFASDSERSIARMVWNRTCMDRYPDQLKNARKVALRHVNSTNLADTKGHGPKGLKPEVWNGLVDIWLKPEWTKKSDANRCNRAAKPDSALHTGGSISFREHKKRMEEEMKQEVSYRDVYAHVHKRKDGGYISRSSKKLIELYDNIMLEKYGEDLSMHPEFDSEAWAEVSGVNKKRRAYEARSLAIGNPGPMSTSHADAIGPSRPVVPTEEYIKEAVNTAMTSFMQTQLAPMLQPILSMIGSSMRQALSQGREAEKDNEDE